MNYDIGILNRALQRAGQEDLSTEDIEEKTVKYRTVSGFYLSTLLLLLAESDWTELKKRIQLEEEADNLTSYKYAYYLPIDCARPISIDDNSLFIVEGDILYTDTQNPILLYITNGKKIPIESLPEEDIGPVFYDGKDYVWKEAEDEEDTSGYIPLEIQDDEPEYKDLILSPELKQCFEYHLAAELSLKITGDKSLFTALLQLALSLQDKAQKTSRSHGESKQNGHDYWAVKLGLADSEDEDYAHY